MRNGKPIFKVGDVKTVYGWQLKGETPSNHTVTIQEISTTMNCQSGVMYRISPALPNQHPAAAWVDQAWFDPDRFSPESAQDATVHIGTDQNS